MPAGAERPGFRGACAGRRCAASHSGLPALLTRTSLIYPAAFFSATTSPGLTHLRNLRDAKVCSRRCEARPPEAGAELKCGSCLSSPPPTPSWASLPRGVPCTGGRSRGDPGWQTDPRSRSGPWTGSGPAASETRCKERPAPSGGGGYGGDAGAPEVASRRTEVPGPQSAWGRPSPPARPSPHRPPAADADPRRRLQARSRSLRAPAAHVRSAPSRGGTWPWPWARARGTWRAEAPISTPAHTLRSRQGRSSLSTFPPRTNVPGLSRGRRREVSLVPHSRARLGSKEALTRVGRLKRLGKFSKAVATSGIYLYHPSSCHFLSLKRPNRPGNPARQSHLPPFYN